MPDAADFDVDAIVDDLIPVCGGEPPGVGSLDDLAYRTIVERHDTTGGAPDTVCTAADARLPISLRWQGATARSPVGPPR
ncbi:hypothetical protein GCM10010121_045030 [Streptomyces brasiliensis]|uniref:Uncharacterized protein n=1 Tax=Streptomyces brasiliensis TaxID=1954 RepID=A0A917KVF3_9ACTN|nr:hypothetical protein GCM10010121_045030 [Streptomyces brasiliensis]